jgi:pro-apoptotic serine protease NMA111
VTIDRHEWYAAPRIYTRDDLTGLWTSKPATQSSLPMLSSPLRTGQSLIDSCSNVGEMGLMDHNYQTGIGVVVVADGCVKMQTDEESLVDGDDLCSEQKRQRVEEDTSMVEGNGLSDGVPDRNLDREYVSLDGTTEDMSHEIGASLSNASLAEQVIEPALVMFEVKLYIFLILFL